MGDVDVEAAVTATNPKRKKRGRKRRSNGNGTVWPERNGFRWQLTLGYDQNGKRIAIGDSCLTRAEAEAALILARADKQRKLLAEPNRITVAEYAQVWLNRQYEIRATTRIKYQTDIGYALSHIGRVRVQDVTPPMLKELLAALSRVPVKTGRPLAMRSISKVATRLRAMFREAVNDKIVYANPMDGVKAPRPEVNEVAAARALTFDQEARLI